MENNEVMPAMRTIHQGTFAGTPMMVGLMLGAQPAVTARQVSPLVESPESLALVAKLTVYEAQLKVFV